MHRAPRVGAGDVGRDPVDGGDLSISDVAGEIRMDHGPARITAQPSSSSSIRRCTKARGRSWWRCELVGRRRWQGSCATQAASGVTVGRSSSRAPTIRGCRRRQGRLRLPVLPAGDRIPSLALAPHPAESTRIGRSSFDSAAMVCSARWRARSLSPAWLWSAPQHGARSAVGVTP